jgi:hypothetical protein
VVGVGWTLIFLLLLLLFLMLLLVGGWLVGHLMPELCDVLAVAHLGIQISWWSKDKV